MNHHRWWLVEYHPCKILRGETRKNKLSVPPGIRILWWYTRELRALSSSRKFIQLISRLLIILLPITVWTACQANSVEDPLSATAPVEQIPTRKLLEIEVATKMRPSTQGFNVPSTVTPLPTSTFTPAPTFTPSATPMPTVTVIASCNDRNPGQDLLTLITLEYGISKEFAPQDLVAISETLPISVTLGYPTQIRQIALEPLTEMIQAMQAEGLRPQIISGYRSFSSQSIAWKKWAEKEPERVAIISAPPGFSEHQLGTTIDFGSPSLAEIVGEEEVEFHTYFYKTGEGQWLAEHAHEYGFTLSYPRETFELTGMFYEPWHYRFVGRELATFLKESNRSLIQYLLALHGPPCIP